MHASLWPLYSHACMLVCGLYPVVHVC